MQWNGKEYPIHPKMTLRAIALVEEHITLFELIRAIQTESPPIAKISMGYAALLRFVGVPSVDDQQIYEMLVTSPVDMTRTIDVMSELITLMVPPKNPILPAPVAGPVPAVTAE